MNTVYHDEHQNLNWIKVKRKCSFLDADLWDLPFSFSRYRYCYHARSFCMEHLPKRLFHNKHRLTNPVPVGGDESAIEPQMAAWGDNLYIVWTSYQGIMFVNSTDGGQNFSEPIKLANYPVNSPVIPAPKFMVNYDNFLI